MRRVLVSFIFLVCCVVTNAQQFRQEFGSPRKTFV